MRAREAYDRATSYYRSPLLIHFRRNYRRVLHQSPDTGIAPFLRAYRPRRLLDSARVFSLAAYSLDALRRQ